MSLTEIGQKLGLGKGSVHRILGTLKARHFVQQDPKTKKYGFGVRAIEMGLALKKEEILLKTIIPILQELSRRCREAINAAVLEYNEIRYIVHLESNEMLRFSIQEGSRLPAHCTALGKVLLSSLSDGELKRIYGRKSAFKNLTKNSIGSFDQLMKVIKDVQEKNFKSSRFGKIVSVHP